MTLLQFLSLAATALQLHLGAQRIQADVGSIDSLTCDVAGQQLVVHRVDSAFTVPIASIDSITFPQLQTRASISFGPDQVATVNPYYFDGLTIECSGNHVKVVSHCDFVIDVEIAGQATDASILIEADQPIRLHLNGVTLASSPSSRWRRHRLPPSSLKARIRSGNRPANWIATRHRPPSAQTDISHSQVQAHLPSRLMERLGVR